MLLHMVKEVNVIKDVEISYPGLSGWTQYNEKKSEQQEKRQCEH